MAKAKPTKVTKEELAEMREIVQNINGIQMDIGSLEVQKARALSAILEWRGKLIENQNKLKLKYGDVNISIADGSIKSEEDGKVDKKN
jgi:hypothetical protein